jgi:hypothetical protein
MTQSIWKYPLKIEDVQTVRMPRGAEILTVQDQKGVLCLWARVTIENPLEDRRFFIYGTGHRHTFMHGKYVASAQQKDGELVWHIFEDSESLAEFKERIGQ